MVRLSSGCCGLVDRQCWNGFKGKHPCVSSFGEKFNFAVYSIAKEFLTEPQKLLSLKLDFELTGMGVQTRKRRYDRGLKESEWGRR